MDHKDMLQLVRDVAPMIGGVFEDSPDDMWRGWIIKGDLKLIFSTSNNKKGEVWAYLYRDSTYRESAKAGEIGCDFSRGADAVAREIQRRLLPVAETFAAIKRDAWKTDDDQKAQVARKAQSLIKKYPHLKIAVRDDKRSISICTKYGAGVHLTGYTYCDWKTGVWSLTSDRGHANLQMDDIDSPDARAILAIINKNGN